MPKTLDPKITLEDLMHDWRRSTIRMQYCHFAAASKFRKLHMQIGVPLTITSIVVGSSIFASPQTIPTTFQLIAGLLTMLVALLTALQTFLRFDARAEKHFAAACAFGALRWDLQQLMAIRSLGRPSAGALIAETRALDAIKSKRADIPKTAPEIPDGIWLRRANIRKDLGSDFSPEGFPSKT